MASGLTGIFSGIDSDVLVSRIMGIESRPLARLNVEKTQWQSRQTAIGDLENRLKQLQALAGKMKTIYDQRRVSAVSSDSDVVGVTSTGGASTRPRCTATAYQLDPDSNHTSKISPPVRHVETSVSLEVNFGSSFG